MAFSNYALISCCLTSANLVLLQDAELCAYALAGVLVSSPQGAPTADSMTQEVAYRILPWLGLQTKDPMVRSGLTQLFIALAQQHQDLAHLVFSSNVQHPRKTTPREWQDWRDALCHALDEAGLTLP